MTIQRRSRRDRRSGHERRRLITLNYFRYKKKNQRKAGDRRMAPERREGWVRLSRWSSINLSHLKISKYLKFPK